LARTVNVGKRQRFVECAFDVGAIERVDELHV
jgi:hypothetical protein